MRDGGGAYKVLWGRSDGKRPLGRPRHGWEDNIKVDLTGSGIRRPGMELSRSG
jgi:hypothetical protein